jgi:peroxiredoxin
MTDDSENTVSPPQEGQLAPDFRLPAVQGEQVHLLELSGRCVILVFFSQSFATYDTMEIRAFVDSYIALRTLDATVIGISTEPVQALRTFAEQEEIPFNLASDFDREVAKAYGVFEEEMDGFRQVARPAVFVVSKKQRIMYRWVSEKLETLPNLDKVIDIIHGFDSTEDIC